MSTWRSLRPNGSHNSMVGIQFAKSAIRCVINCLVLHLVFAQLDSLDVVVKSTLMSVRQHHVTMEESAQICHKATDANAHQDTLEKTVKMKKATANRTRAQRAPCARMNQDTATTLACAAADTLDPTVMLQLTHAQRMETLARTAPLASH